MALAPLDLLSVGIAVAAALRGGGVDCPSSSAVVGLAARPSHAHATSGATDHAFARTSPSRSNAERSGRRSAGAETLSAACARSSPCARLTSWKRSTGAARTLVLSTGSSTNVHSASVNSAGGSAPALQAPMRVGVPVASLLPLGWFDVDARAVSRTVAERAPLVAPVAVSSDIPVLASMSAK